MITNEEMKNLIKPEGDNYFVLDVRENIEFESGHFPGATHIRSADLKSGDWETLPKDRQVVVE